MCVSALVHDISAVPACSLLRDLSRFVSPRVAAGLDQEGGIPIVQLLVVVLPAQKLALGDGLARVLGTVGLAHALVCAAEGYHSARLFTCESGVTCYVLLR
jgi:hypothetical protein